MMIDQIYNGIEDQLVDINKILQLPKSLDQAKEILNILEDTTECLRIELEIYSKSGE